MAQICLLSHKDRLNKPLLMPSRDTLSLDWWKELSNVHAGIPFTNPSNTDSNNRCLSGEPT